MVAFLSWNIDGISKKLKDDEIVSMIVKYDIVALQETHTATRNVSNGSVYTNLNNYNTYIKHSKKTKGTKCGRGSGGLLFLYRDDLSPYIDTIHSNNDYTQWIKLNGNMFGWDKDIYICNFYIPPQESPYYSNQFDELESEIARFSSIGNILLMGDANSRTGGPEPLLDYILDDSSKYIPGLENYNEDSSLRQRHCIDKTVNAHGKKLAELCISTQIRILNGRTAGDYVGKSTCFNHFGTSTVDYFLSSSNFIDNVLALNIKEITRFSVHCPLSLILKCNMKPLLKDKLEMRTLPKKIKINKLNAHTYLSHLTSNIKRLSEINSQQQIHTCVNQHNVDRATSNLTNIIIEAAYKTAPPLLHKKSKQNKRTQKTNPGNDKDIKTQKKEFQNLAKLLHKYPNDPIIRGRLFKVKKRLNRLIKTKNNFNRNKLFEKLEDMQNSDPKSYWDLINGFLDKNPDQNIPECIKSSLFSHFKELSTDNITEQEPEKQNDIKEQLKQYEKHTNIKSTLDQEITQNEVEKVISSLKNNKSCAEDGITSEMIKYGRPLLLLPITKLFNDILTSGHYPDLWSLGHLVPIHKKGSKLITNNYRGITLSSVLGKVFSGVLNNRLQTYLEENRLINENQSGFRKGRRTTDNLFILKTIINKYLCQKNKSLYIAFIDFSKAFDHVWRDGLLVKLLKLGVTGNLYNIIKAMYENTFAHLKINNQVTINGFKINRGVKQGDNLSPTLFNIFLNDLIFPEDICDAPTLYQERLTHLLWADDLLIMSESEVGLQNSLSHLDSFCQKWRMTINTDKSNVMLIQKGKRTSNRSFYLQNQTLKIVEEYKYLGCIIDNKGAFNLCKQDLHKKGLKALFKLYTAFAGSPPKPHIYNNLFDTLITPIILYNCELWGADYINRLKRNSMDKFYCLTENEPFEKLHNKFCKINLQVGKKSINMACKGELGRYPLINDINFRIVKYWHYLENTPINKTFLRDAYECDKTMKDIRGKSWSSYIEELSQKININLEYLRQQKTLLKVNKTIIKTNLKNEYIKFYNNKIMTYEKLLYYRYIEGPYQIANYLKVIKNSNFRQALTKLRIGAHRLEIETGRYTKTERHQRICKLCKTEIEDEVHFLISCKINDTKRTKLFNKMKHVYDGFSDMTNLEKYYFIINGPDYYSPVAGEFIYEMFYVRGQGNKGI